MIEPVTGDQFEVNRPKKPGTMNETIQEGSSDYSGTSNKGPS